MMTVSELKKIIGREFKNCLQPLTDISWDSANGQALVKSNERFHNYDRMADIVYRGENKPKTPDMIYFKRDTLVFVEFKNGKIGPATREQIKLKAIEGGFIVLYRIISTFSEIDFSDIYQIDKSYIVVYHTEKNPIDAIHGHLYSRETRFGLEIYEGIFFKRIKTVSPQVFILLLTGKGEE
jgi:hypothetical protein